MSTAVAQIESFLERSRNRHLSENTLQSYQRDLEKLLSWIQEQDIDSFSDVSVAQLQQFLASGRRNGQSSATLARLASSLRALYRFLVNEGEIDSNPADGLKAPKQKRLLPSVFSVDEMGRLLDLPSEDPLDLRDRAMFELFYSSGLRLSELIAVNVDDLRGGETILRVFGKGAKQRDVPVGRVALEAIQRWSEVRPGFARQDETALFVGERGRRISAGVIQRRLKQRAVRAGVSAAVHPHLLRHSFATHMLESSGDLRAVQELLGHENLSTTQIYTHLNFQHLASVYDQAHPRARSKPDSGE